MAIIEELLTVQIRTLAIWTIFDFFHSNEHILRSAMKTHRRQAHQRTIAMSALFFLVGPLSGSPVVSKLPNASRTVLPISKHFPVLDIYPSLH